VSGRVGAKCTFISVIRFLVIRVLHIFKGAHFGRHFGRLSVALSASHETAALSYSRIAYF